MRTEAGTEPGKVNGALNLISTGTGSHSNQE